MCAAAAASVQFLRTLETCIDDGIFDTNQEEIREQLARFDTLVATNAPLAELNRQATLLLLVSLRPLTLVIERISQQIPIEQAHTLSQKISVTFENLVQLLSTDEWTNQLPKEVTENLKAFQNMLIQKFGRAMLETKQVT